MKFDLATFRATVLTSALVTLLITGHWLMALVLVAAVTVMAWHHLSAMVDRFINHPGKPL